MADQKVCSVICPIGEPGSEIRKRADDLFDFVIRPVVEERGYRPERADKINTSGIITTHIVKHLVQDDLGSPTSPDTTPTSSMNWRSDTSRRRPSFH